jgi:hypothetical protein
MVLLAGLAFQEFAFVVESTTLADGDYQLIPEQEEVYSEDPGNLVADFSEAPN